jgi:hypothetical protein
VRQTINDISRPHYQASEGITFSRNEMDQINQIPLVAQTARDIRASELLNARVRNLPDNSIGFLNKVKQELDTAAENIARPTTEQRNVSSAGTLQESANQLRDALISKSAGTFNIGTQQAGHYGTALGLQEGLRRGYLEPLLQGPLGRIINAPETQGAINALFPRNPLPNSAQEITRTVSALANRNATAAEQLVRAHAESVFNEAARSLGAEGRQFTGGSFAVRLAGNPQQRANLQAAIEALPNGPQRWAGFQRFLDTMEATGRRQQMGSLTEFNRQELQALSGSGALGEAAKIGLSPGKWLTFMGDKFQHWQLGHNLDEIARIITDPASANLLRRIVNMPAGSPAANAIAARIMLQTLEGSRVSAPANVTGQ